MPLLLLRCCHTRVIEERHDDADAAYYAADAMPARAAMLLMLRTSRLLSEPRCHAPRHLRFRAPPRVICCYAAMMIRFTPVRQMPPFADAAATLTPCQFAADTISILNYHASPLITPPLTPRLADFIFITLIYAPCRLFSLFFITRCLFAAAMMMRR